MSFSLHPNLQRDAIILGEFELCLVMLINDMTYPWFVLVPQRDGIRDAIDLSKDDYLALCNESRTFGAAIMQIFEGEKLNVAAIGNITPQLHVHHIVRYSSDPAWPAPVWGHQPMRAYTDAELQNRRLAINDAGILGFSPR